MTLFKLYSIRDVKEDVMFLVEFVSIFLLIVLMH